MQGCPQVGRYVLSTGSNWYTCYKCSYDLCLACVHRRLDRVSREDVIIELVEIIVLSIGFYELILVAYHNDYKPVSPFLGSVTSVARGFPWTRGHVASTGGNAAGDTSRCSARSPLVR